MLLGGFLYAREVEPRRVEVAYLKLTLPRLAPEFDGYRIAQISDVHLDGWMTHERLSAIVELVNGLQPDLVAITGDFVTSSLLYSTGRLAPLLSVPLDRLRTPDGTVAVLGNHDHLSDTGSVSRSLRKAGILELANDVHTLRRGNAALHIAGVDDPKSGRDRLDLVLNKLPEKGAAILLSHEPDFADTSAPTGRFDLQLSGHSHGGQVRLPLLGPLFLPPLSRRYPAGLYEVKDMLQYTNRGVGVAHLRLRFFCQPEITILALVAPP